MKRLLAAALLLALPLAAQDTGAAYKLDQVAVRLDGQAGGAASYSAIAAPSGCAAGYLAVFLGSPVRLNCDAGLTYDAATDQLLVGGNIFLAGTTAIGVATAGSTGTPFRALTAGYSNTASEAFLAKAFLLSASGALASDVGWERGAAGQAAATDGNGAARDVKMRHLIGAGTAPTVAGNGTTNGTVAGSDLACQITVGTGTTTSIVLTFGTAFANAPACVVAAATTGTPINVSTTVSAATLTTTAFTAGEVLHVLCGGF